jgi:hypothetical protein
METPPKYTDENWDVVDLSDVERIKREHIENIIKDVLSTNSSITDININIEYNDIIIKVNKKKKKSSFSIIKKIPYTLVCILLDHPFKLLGLLAFSNYIIF